ncbi:MAG: phosphoribosylanthranilate isomerase [Planctomycetota bacterium]|jgi:phosphoribosylanthranilate isomerase
MTRRTRIKICGITRLDDAFHASSLGADSIGLVFHRPSARFIDISAALAIRRSLPPFVTVTALFLDESEDWIKQVLEQVKPDCLQFHGSESVSECEIWDRPYIKSIPMGSVDDPEAYSELYTGAQGMLLDSNAAGRRGGSGDTFDWSKIPSTLACPIILAGGLDPSNVAQAIEQIHPWGVDVSSGVESAKGIKDARLVTQFFDQVFTGDSK